MKAKNTSPWDDTPATSERVVGAISRIAAVLRAGAWQFATSEGLNPTQVEILEMLLARSEGVRLSWIAQQLGVTNASASDSITSLHEKKLVKKGRAVDDGRAVAVKLTASGRTLAEKISDARKFAFEAVDQLPQQTQQALFTSLLALVGSLQKAERFPEIRACVTCRHFAPNVHANETVPHHCRLVNAPLPTALLRLDCPEHVQADPMTAQKNWKHIG